MTATDTEQRGEDAIEHPDLTEMTYQRLRHGILSGRYPVGDRLQVTILSDQLGVSHTPVKIALNRLASEGLVERVPRRGMFVTRPSRKKVEEIQEVRLLIEIHAITVGTALATAGHLADLHLEVDRYAELVDRRSIDGWSVERAAELNESFHEKIVALAGNEKLLEIWRSLQIQQQIVRLNSLVPEPRPTEVLAQHRSILDGLEAGDVESALRALEKHLAYTKAHLASIVDKLNE